ncbi:MAG: TetR/AcrR family transcriptional regulator [Allomuricauda sp.]|nr:MAG: TetR/AcrR family transcriptional regulator [Allomuricauda sp.]
MDFYMDAVVKNQGKPSDVESWSKAYNFNADKFDEHFESFEELDKTIFKTLIDVSIATLIETPDFTSFSKKDKLLSLYYTLFENFTLNRDFIQLTIKGYGLSFNTISLFSELKESFMGFVESLQIATLSLNDTMESIQKKSIKEGFWVQFLLTVKFWMDDDSDQGEKTDIFIEKSINTGLELLNTQSLNNIIDLGKFLYAEKIKS